MANGAQFLVLDDFLDEDAWTRLWTEFQFLELNPVTRSQGAWKLDDGVPLGGQEIILPRSTSTSAGAHARTRSPARKGTQPAPLRSSPIAHLLECITEQRDALESLVSGNWDRVVGRPWVYPRGTGLSWHVDDSQIYAGAFIYYAHPTWNAHWGGELLIGETAATEDGEPLPVMGYRFETESYSERLLEVGGGAFVMPKPNRLVLVAGAPHMVAKVSDAAGHNVRASIAGFFLRPTKPAPAKAAPTTSKKSPAGRAAAKKPAPPRKGK